MTGNGIKRFVVYCLLTGWVLSGQVEFMYAAELPLPSVDEVLKRIAESTAREPTNNAAFKQKYRFVRSKLTEYRNGDGKVIKHEERVSTNNPTAVLKVKPVSVVVPPPVSKTNSYERTLGVDKIRFSPDLFLRSDCTLAGREVLNDRPALVLDFKPKSKKLSDNSFVDRFLNRISGRAWIDEAEGVVARADLSLTTQMNLAGGLLGAIKKFVYHYNRERTGDGLWFPRTISFHVEGREVCFARIVDGNDERSEVVKVK